MTDQSRIELHKMYQRQYDGDAPLDPDARAQFVSACVVQSLRAFQAVVRGVKAGDIRTVFGRRSNTFDHHQNRMTPPPYYLWCRCDYLAPIGNVIAAIPPELQRDRSGLLARSAI